MSEAYICDRCGSFLEGKPHGLVQLQSENDKHNAEICESCFQSLVDELSD